MNRPGEQPSCPQSGQAAAYVLDALEPEDDDRYEQHLRGCLICREEVAHLQPAVDLLAQTTPRAPAPETLRERVMAQVRAEAELLRAAGPQADLPPRRRQYPRRLAALSAAAALGCGVGVGVLVAGSGGQSSLTLHAQVAHAASASRAELVRTGGHAELILAHMPPPPVGKIYQVWLARPGRTPQPTDALFSVNKRGNGSVAVPGNLKGVRQVMVTAEPLGGSRHPTSAPIIIATL
jgi:anti-sigma-K factor RskA